MHHGVSCIIATHNEGERILPVINAALHCPEVKEVIVVNDGSIDNTKQILKAFPDCQVFNLPQNRGKAYAISFGVSKTSYDILAFLDADLTGITSHNLSDLIRPVLRDPKSVALSMRKSHMLRSFGIDIFTGERVLHRKYFEDMGDLSRSGYALEIIMNQYFLDHKIKFTVVDWPNVSAPAKTNKIGFIEGTKGEVKMFTEMNKEERIETMLYQFLRMTYAIHDPKFNKKV